MGSHRNAKDREDGVVGTQSNHSLPLHSGTTSNVMRRRSNRWQSGSVHDVDIDSANKKLLEFAAEKYTESPTERVRREQTPKRRRFGVRSGCGPGSGSAAMRNPESQTNGGYERAVRRYGIGMDRETEGTAKGMGSVAAAESDFTSIFSSGSESDGVSLYKRQLKRWRLRQQCRWCWCCCFGVGSVGGSLCNGMAAMLRYKGMVVLSAMSVMAVLLILCSFWTPFPANLGISDFSEFGISSISKTASVICGVSVAMNWYFAVSFYGMRRRNELRDLKEQKMTKQIRRGKERREHIAAQHQRLCALRNQSEKQWNRLIVIEQHFAFWLKSLGETVSVLDPQRKSKRKQNRNGNRNRKDIGTAPPIRDDDDDEKVMAKGPSSATTKSGDDVLRSVYSAVKRYNADVERLILMKLQNDIEDHCRMQNEDRTPTSKMMARSQFDRFCNKIPHRHRRRFLELKLDGDPKQIPFLQIEAVFHQINKRTISAQRRQRSEFENETDRNQNGKGNGNGSGRVKFNDDEPTSISKLYGGYLQYGADLDVDANVFIDDGDGTKNGFLD